MKYYELTIRIPKQPWRWIRFRIVTILLLIVILAMGLAWYRDHARLTSEIDRLTYPGPHWEASQATGPPNSGTSEAPTAWCSLTADGQQEWLVLEYDDSVVPKAIVVHENHGPGALRRVSHLPKFGAETTLWEGTDPTPPTATSGVSRLPIIGGVKTNRIKLYLDSPAVQGWNEIDAVGLVYGDHNQTIWAQRATASSSWGEQSGQTMNFSGGILTR